MELSNYQFEPLQEAACFLVEHIYNQKMIKGVQDGNAEEYYRLLMAATNPEQIKIALNAFIDSYTKQNTELIEGESFPEDMNEQRYQLGAAPNASDT